MLDGRIGVDAGSRFPGVRPRLAILGATGSIGSQALSIVRAHPHRFAVTAVSADASAESLKRIVGELRPRLAALRSPPEGFRPETPGTDWAFGEAALVEAAQHPEVDVVLNAVVGAAGLRASLAAIGSGKRLLLANKESLVAGGALIMAALRERGGELIPVDSEHTAIFQCLRGNGAPESLILTASGGPLRTWTKQAIDQARPEDVLAHPVWSMGRKITVDCATMMNKGLEVIEARWLFDMPSDRIEVLVHPQSVVHSAVRYPDGAILAQMGVPDMAGPIAYALAYPERLPQAMARLDLTRAPLTFEQPDMDRFPCLRLARTALEAGGLYPAVLNAANEEAVSAFLSGAFPLGGIAAAAEEALSAFGFHSGGALEDVLVADAWARERVRGRIEN